MTAARINTVIICFDYGRSVQLTGFIQQKRGLNPPQLLIDGRRKPIDEKMQENSPRIWHGNRYALLASKENFLRFLSQALAKRFRRSLSY